jgi:hypothetical protein
MVAQIWSELTLPDLLIYGGTSTTNYAIVQNAINRSLHKLIDKFIFNGGMEQFLNLLQSTRAVISGSMALFFLFSCSFTGVNSSTMKWSPADMDIYELNIGQEVSEVVRYLISMEGFKEVACRFVQGGDKYYPLVRKVTQLRKKDLHVDVITTYASSAIAAIFGFHSTPVMNWISGDGFFSAYPLLTSSKQGLVNPMTFALKNFIPALPSSHTRAALAKYYNRGFDIRRNPNCWPAKKHICSADVNCPHTVRSVINHGTMYVRFKKPAEEEGVQLIREIDYTAPYKSPYILFWSLGGLSCNGRHRVCSPFVMLREEAEELTMADANR